MRAEKRIQGIDGVKEQGTEMKLRKAESQGVIHQFMISEVEQYPVMTHHGCLEYSGNELSEEVVTMSF